MRLDLEDGPDGSTRMTIRHYGLRDERERKHYQEGWEHCLARLRAFQEAR